MSRDTITWWGCAAFLVEVDGRTIAIDPMVNPRDYDVNYICITHDDFDHCHEPTLKPLCGRGAFEKLIVAPSCAVKSRLDSPIPPSAGAQQDLAYVPPEKLVVMYPKHTLEPGKQHEGPTELSLDGFDVETVDSGERPERYQLVPGELWPSGRGAFAGDGQYPNLGYVIRSQKLGLSFYHPGDLSQVFDGLHALQGQIDVMFFPLPKLQGAELTMIDVLRPKFIVPMHYRLEDSDFPIPSHVSHGDLEIVDPNMGHAPPEADAEMVRRDLNILMAGHAYPTVRQPALKRITELEKEIEAMGTKVVRVKAGARYELADLFG